MAKHLCTFWLQISVCHKNFKLLHGPTGYDDVIALCAPIARVARYEAAKDESEPEDVIGFVHLMKSGRHYKMAGAIRRAAANTSLRFKCRKSSSLCIPSAQMIRQGSRTIGTDNLQINAKTENGLT
jgi:hypothetical protein